LGVRADDGFRALVDTNHGLRVISRRGWNMTERLPKLGALSEGLTLDGELIAWGKTRCRRGGGSR